MKKSDGMAALLTVIIIGMAALTMTISSSIISVDQLETHYSLDKGREAILLADSCLSDALRKIKLNPLSVPLSGYTLPINDGFCIINMPDNSTINASGQAGDYTKHIEAKISISGVKVILNNWREN